MTRFLAVFVFVAFVFVALPVRADGADALFDAMGSGTAADVKAAIEAGANVNARNEDGATPLHTAAVANLAPSVIMALIEGGANPNARTERGSAPLHWAVNHGDAGAIIALLAGGADVNARDEGGKTALHYAAAESAIPSVIKALIEVGADPGARDNDGKTPFDYAKDNEALKGTDAYWRLNDGRFE